MAGTFILGETKVRPGTYFNIQKKGGNATAGVMNGVTAVIFRADFGPLNEAIELSAEDGYEGTFGIALTTDAMKEAIAGGAKTIIACRVGNGGTQGSIKLQDSEATDAVSITAKYPGAKDFVVTVREKLSDSTLKECIFYAGTTEFEKVEFAAGTDEANALVDALASSKNFKAEVIKSGTVTLQNVSQSQFTKGTDPQVTNGDYSNAFKQVEAYEFNTICVDTEDTSVHLLLQSFINRIFDAASLTQAVVAEKHTVDLETREAHAASFNDEKMHYVLNAHVNEQGTEIDGYQTAARIAGMIGAVAANSSLTHTVVSGFSEIKEKLTNTEMIAAEKKGCLVLSYNKAKQVWIDNAINTLITPKDNQDDGWKKIRRVKTRFELIRRINTTSDNLVGKVDNDTNGRATVISQLQGVGDAMKEEGSGNLKAAVQDSVTSNLEQTKENVKILVVSGERRGESKGRSKYNEIEIHRTNAPAKAHRIVHQWRPVIDYSERDIWEVLKRHKVNPHPCYRAGWNRCSCAMCIFSTPKLFAGIKEIYPEEFEALKRDEEILGFTLDNKCDLETFVGDAESCVYHGDFEALRSLITGEFTIDDVYVKGRWMYPAGAFHGAEGGPC